MKEKEVEKHLENGPNILCNCEKCQTFFEIPASIQIGISWRKVNIKDIENCLKDMGWKKIINGGYICNECYKTLSKKIPNEIVNGFLKRR